MTRGSGGWAAEGFFRSVFGITLSTCAASKLSFRGSVRRVAQLPVRMTATSHRELFYSPGSEESGSMTDAPEQHSPLRPVVSYDVTAGR